MRSELSTSVVILVQLSMVNAADLVQFGAVIAVFLRVVARRRQLALQIAVYRIG